MKIMDKLSTYAALIGVIGAIGGGFYTWGQFNSRLDAIEATPPVNLAPLKDKDKELNAKVEEKIQPVDLTSVFSQIGKVREEIAMLDIPEGTDLTEVYAQISAVKQSIASIKIPNIDGLKKDIKEIRNSLSDMEKNIAIALKENEVQDVMIEEIKLANSNPLGN